MGVIWFAKIGKASECYPTSPSSDLRISFMLVRKEIGLTQTMTNRSKIRVNRIENIKL